MLWTGLLQDQFNHAVNSRILTVNLHLCAVSSLPFETIPLLFVFIENTENVNGALKMQLPGLH